MERRQSIISRSVESTKFASKKRDQRDKSKVNQLTLVATMLDKPHKNAECSQVTDRMRSKRLRNAQKIIKSQKLKDQGKTAQSRFVKDVKGK